jgi:hypothetical protein
MCIIISAALCFLATGSFQQLQDSHNSSCIAAFTAASLAAPTPEVKLLQFCLDVSICLDYLTSPQFPSPGGMFRPCPAPPASEGISLEARVTKVREGAGPIDRCAWQDSRVETGQIDDGQLRLRPSAGVSWRQGYKDAKQLATLTVLSGHLSSSVIAIPKRRVLIGRALDCQLRLVERRASRHRCALTFRRS